MPGALCFVRIIVFSLMIGILAVLGHLYLYFRLVRKVAPGHEGRRWRRAGGAVLALMTVLLVLRHPIRELGPGLEHAYELVAYGWIALALCMVVAVAVGDLLGVGIAAGRWVDSLVRARSRSADEASSDSAPAPLPPGVAEAVDPSRRRFLGSTLHFGVLAGGGLTTAYGAFRAFAPPEVSERSVHLPGLPPTLDGLRILQLSDIHVGPFIDHAFLEQLVEVANAQQPDLVAVTGDLVDGNVRMLGDAVATLRRLRSRYGTFFVTGNHEYYSGDLQWTRFLERLGLTVLRNRRVSIGDAGGSFDLVGVDDWSGGRRRGGRGYDLDAALAGRRPERAAVLLAHQPANFEDAAERGVGLQLSGHTHGGQLFPMTMLVGLGWKYSRGLYRHGSGHIYVSRGCGFWGPPARVGSPPEVAVINLSA